MDDGLYILWRKIRARTPKASQVLSLSAYNNNPERVLYYDSDADEYYYDGAEFYPNLQTRQGIYDYWWAGGDPQNGIYVVPIDCFLSNWSNYPYYLFVQDNLQTGIMTEEHALQTAGPGCRFLFPTPGVSSGTITKVSIWAYVQGSAKTILRHSSTDYFGSLVEGDVALGWIHTDYTSKPWGGSWAWADLARGTLIAGAWGETGYSVSTHGTTWAATKIFRDSTLILKIKVIIEYTVDDVAQTPIVLWPDGDSTMDNYPNTFVGNVLSLDPNTSLPWDDLHTAFDASPPSFLIGGPACIYGALPGYVVSTLKNVPPAGSTIDQLKLYYQVASRDYYGTQTVKPFLQIGGTKYYGTQRTLPIQGWGPDLVEMYVNNHTWTTNPATGQAWAYGDLAGVTWGLEFFSSGQQNVRVVLQFFIYDWDLEIKYNGSSYAHNYHGDLSSNHTLDAIGARPLMYTYLSSAGTRTWRSNLAELPPKHSIINSVNIDYKYYGFTEIDNTHHTIQPFLYYKGNYYYATTDYLGQDPAELIEGTYTWSVNPDTSEPWAYEDLFGLQFGMLLTTDSTRPVRFLMKTLTANIDFSPNAFEDVVEYQKVAGKLLFYKKNNQIPLNPDELHFASNDVLSERVEVVYFVDGRMDFHGLIWKIDLLAKEYVYTAYSQIMLLNYRHLPTIARSSGSITNDLTNPTFEAPFNTLNDLLSDLVPTYPFNQFPAARSWEWGVSGHYWVGWHPIRFYQTSDSCDMGILFLINSCAPMEHDGTKFINVDPRIKNKLVLSTNHNTSVFENDFLSGNFVLSPIAAAPGPGEYYYNEAAKTLTLHELPNTKIIVIDHLYDTFIRPGNNELGTNVIEIDTIQGGPAADVLISILNNIGQEVRFRNDLDGFIYMDTADEVSAGTAAEPVKIYEHGVNCDIKFIVPRDPPASAVVGGTGPGSKPGLATTWDFKKPFFEKMVSFADLEFEADIKQAADIILADNAASFDITLPYLDSLISPGDWIWAKAKDRGYEAVRIQEITIADGKTQLLAGNIKKASAISGWVNSIQRKTRRTTEIWPTMAGPKSVTFDKWFNLAKSVDIDFSGPTGTKTFIIPAADIKNGAWAVKLEMAWSLSKGSGVETGVIYGPNQGNMIVTPFGSTPAGVYDLLCTIRTGGDVNYFKWRYNGGAWSADIYYNRFTNPNYIWGDGFEFPDGKGVKCRINKTGAWDGVTAYVDDSWSIIQGTMEYATRMDMFLILKLNGKIIPPGRIKADGHSGTIELDLTPYIDYSESEDTTNTLEATLVYGYPASTTGFCHKLSGSIKQFTKTKMVNPV